MAARVFAKKAPETNTTVRTPLEIVAFAAGAAADSLKPTKPSPMRIPIPSTGMKATVRFWLNAAEKPERVMLKEDSVCTLVGVNEIVAVTKAPATLELSLTRRSKSDGVMRDMNPEFVLSEAISPEVENPLKTAEIS